MEFYARIFEDTHIFQKYTIIMTLTIFKEIYVKLK